jgi:hypothetical protein
MALKVEKGVLTVPGGTGNQTVTLADGSFGTVKAIMLWGTIATAETNTANDSLFALGFGTYRSAAAQQWSVNHFADDAASSTVSAGGQSTASILHGLSAGATPTAAAGTGGRGRLGMMGCG